MQKIGKRAFWSKCYHINAVGMIVGASICMLIQVILWCTVGAPIGMFYHLRGSIPLLPRWLYMLLDLLIHGCLGASLGMVLCDRRYYCEIQKYRGAFYFLLAIVAGYLYYGFYFGIGFFLVSFVLAVMETFALVIAMLNFFHVLKISALLSGIGCLWALYRLFLSFFSFFVI